LSDDHLLPLAAGWGVWRWFCLRGAGLPAALIDELAGAGAATAARSLIERERERTAAGERLVSAASDDRDRAQRLRKRVRALAPVDGSDAEEWNRARLAAEEARAEAERHYAADRGAAARRLREIARSPRFLEALLWQNPELIELGVNALLRQPLDAADSKTRQKEATVASYLSRYCLKNDTIGFFGPVGWGRFSTEPRFDLRPGPALLEKRTVYWEHWAMQTLAEKLAENDELRTHLAPRRMPSIRVEGTTLFHPIERRSELPEEFARVLAACDGVRPARAIAETLEGFSDPGEVYQLLEELREQKLITWTLESPNAGAHPELLLRQLLAGVPGAAGEEARQALDELEAAREQVARAAGDPEALRVKLQACRETFTRCTGAESTREHGRTYAGRTPIYEDCRRGVSLELGILQSLAEPLSLVLASARWYTYEIARRYRRQLHDIHRELGSADWFRFWERARALFPGGAVGGSIVDSVRRELWKRWGEILIGSQVSAAEIRPAVQKAFAAPSPGWPGARYHSPDVLLAAHDPEHLDEALFVLGELHTGMNTLSGLLFVKEHPTPDEVVEWRERDLPLPCVAPVWSKARSRADFYSLSRHDFDLEVGEARSWRPREQVLQSSDLELLEEAGLLYVTTRDRRRRFEIIAFLEQHLLAESYAHFSLFGPQPRLPRVAIDRLVVQRARWQLGPERLTFANAETQVDRFVEAQRLALEEGLPRRLFLKVPEEEKPCYVDLESPLYVEVAARLLRRAASATLSEMLPLPEQCWLRDAGGSAYTCELRIAARDAGEFAPEG
jgi:hypothetical protein